MVLLALFCVFFVIQVGYGTESELDKRVLLEDSYYEITSRLDDLTQRVQACETMIKNQQPVAFKAHLSQAVSPAANQRIVFDDVQFNLGGAYHPHLGGFLAPVNGTYMFSVSVCSDGGHFVVLNLMRNEDMIGRVLAGDDSYADCSSETTVTMLHAGDEVFVQHHGAYGDLVQAKESILDSFTGSLLQAL